MFSGLITNATGRQLEIVLVPPLSTMLGSSMGFLCSPAADDDPPRQRSHVLSSHQRGRDARGNAAVGRRSRKRHAKRRSEVDDWGVPPGILRDHALREAIQRLSGAAGARVRSSNECQGDQWQGAEGRRERCFLLWSMTATTSYVLGCASGGDRPQGPVQPFGQDDAHGARERGRRDHHQL
eukprot:scaffold1071_cov252-Pinguiococcus_pyrenoidosus.AAC.12